MNPIFERQVLIMENENNNNNMNQNTSDSMYHYGRNESPFGKEDVSGKADNNAAANQTYSSQPSSNQTETYTQTSKEAQSNNTYQSTGTNPYSQGNVYGQGIYTGNDFGSAPDQKKHKKEKKAKKPSNGKLKKVGLLLGSAAVFGLVAGGVMVGVNTAGNHLLGNDKKTANVATVTTTDSGVKTTSEDDVSSVVENVMPSMVSITNTSVQTVRSWFQSYEQEVQGSGSGIIIGQTDDSVLVATNNHVIEGAKEITVAFCDETAAAATVKGSDSSADLAVLEIKTSDMEADTLSKIKVAALGSSDDLKLGESAIAIGNALGYGQSVTVGHISALNREVDTENNQTMKMLQTDAAINPGNSGGALLNSKGEVIGINTVKYVDSKVEGMGYAIPISTAIPIINDLMNQEVIEESEQGYLGIQGNDITDEYAKNFNMPNGVYVSKIVEGSPAEQCGLKAGDIITKFADRDVTSMETLQNILTNKKAGEEVEMIVQRNNEKGEYKEVTLKVTLGAKKDMPEDSKKDATTESTTQQSTQSSSEMTPDEFFNEFFNN